MLTTITTVIAHDPRGGGGWLGFFGGGGGAWTKCKCYKCNLVVNTLVMGAVIGGDDAIMTFFRLIINVDNTNTIHLEWNVCNVLLS